MKLTDAEHDRAALAARFTAWAYANRVGILAQLSRRGPHARTIGKEFAHFILSHETIEVYHGKERSSNGG